MQKRGDSKEAIQTRIEIDREKFQNVREVCDVVIENKNLEGAVEKILELV